MTASLKPITPAVTQAVDVDEDYLGARAGVPIDAALNRASFLLTAALDIFKNPDVELPDGHHGALCLAASAKALLDASLPAVERNAREDRCAEAPWAGWQRQLGAHLVDELASELQAAHRIIANGLAVMTTAQKIRWAETNARDGVEGESATRANERLAVLDQAMEAAEAESGIRVSAPPMSPEWCRQMAAAEDAKADRLQAEGMTDRAAAARSRAQLWRDGGAA